MGVWQLIVVLMLAGSSGSAGIAVSAALAPSVPPPPGVVQVVVIGDSLSTGVMTGGDAWTGHEASLLTSMGLAAAITSDSENGAGYAALGDSGDTFLDLVNRTVNARTRVVVLFGSDNDFGQPGLDIDTDVTMATVARLAPHAALIVVGPPSAQGDPGQQLTDIRRILRSAAERNDGLFVDTLTLQWFQGHDSAYIGPDGEHPNAAGEVYLARQMATLLAPVISDIQRGRRGGLLAPGPRAGDDRLRTGWSRASLGGSLMSAR